VEGVRNVRTEHRRVKGEIKKVGREKQRKLLGAQSSE
jgi:hypothetical protein